MDFTDPAVRWGIALGVASGLIIAAIALIFLEGTMRYLVLGIAALDVVTTPWILQQAAEENGADEAEETY